MKKVALAGMLLMSTATVGWAQDKLVIAARDSILGDTLAGTVERYKEVHPDANIEVLNLSYSGLYDKLVVNMREGTKSVDVVLMDGFWQTEFVDNGWLKNLDGYGPLPEDVIESASDVGMSDGSRYSVPWIGNVQMFAYRADLFAEAGIAVPRTFTEVIAAAEKLSDENMAGIVFRGVKPNPIVTSFTPVLRAYGGMIIDENGAVAINSPETVNAINAFKSLRDVSSKDIMAYDSGEVRTALQQGTTAMAMDVWPSWVPDLDNPNVSTVVGKIELVPMPGEDVPGKPVTGVWTFGIASDSDQADAAWDFIKFATSAENELHEVLNNNKPPVHRGSFSNSDAVAMNRFLPSQLESLEIGEARPKISNYNRVEDVIGDYLSLAMTDQMTAEEAAENMQRALTRIIKSN